jgi:glycosyltransferase involved in cell wall biosynthesis
MAFDGGSVMKKKILLKAPLLTRSGYGEQSRFALRALRSREDLFEIFIHPLQWGQTSWMAMIDVERAWIDQTIEKTIAYVQQGGQFDISIQVTIPNEWETLAPVNVGYTAGIETTKVAHQWIQKGNEMDKIIVVSNHSKNIFKDTAYIASPEENSTQQVELRLSTEIDAVDYPTKSFENLPDLNISFDYDINFLTVAQFGPRKNIPSTVKWFVEEFRDEEVGLILKTNLAKNCLMDREKVTLDLTMFLREQGERKCKVYLIHGDMEDDEIHSLYVHPQISALISLAHGEGFGLPIFEACYSGMPVICTGWSGQLDFLVDENRKEHFYNIAFDMGPVPDEVVWEGVLIKESMWAYPRENSTKEQMRLCYEDITEKREDSIALKSCEYATVVNERFSETKQNALFIESLSEFIETEEGKEWRDVLDQVVTYD